MDWTSIIITLITSVATIVTVVIQNGRTRKSMDVNDYKTYLLVLLANYPGKVDEILTVGKYYFQDLGGDSFLLPIFEDWLNSKNIHGSDVPEWFLTSKAKHPKS